MHSQKYSIAHWKEAPRGDYGVIGDPIAHSWSPLMHLAAFHASGLSYSYHAIQVPLIEFEEAIQYLMHLSYKGLNVTTPLKETAYRWAENISEEDKDFLALNTLDLLHKTGTNTDAPGFLDTLKDLHITKEKKILVLGAGSTARVIVKVLAENKYTVYLYNRTTTKAIELIQDLNLPIIHSLEPSRGDIHLVINATSVNLKKEELTLNWNSFSKTTLAYDLSYAPQATPFMKKAEQAGLKAIDGRFLLAAQGARSFKYWLGFNAPKSLMLTVLQGEELPKN